jgi:hemolysin III
MAPVVLAAGIVLIAVAHPGVPRACAVVYAICGLLLFATSGVYHRGRWGAGTHRWLQRADHANIYLLIAGTYTPIAALGLSGAARTTVLTVVWVGAGLGVAARWWWPQAPRALTTTLYVVLGWSIVPYAGALTASVGPAVAALTLAGGVLYTLGAVVYALKRPDPSPTWFGFHEVFHAATLAAWACQYIAVSLLVYRAG